MTLTLGKKLHLKKILNLNDPQNNPTTVYVNRKTANATSIKILPKISRRSLKFSILKKGIMPL